ncbi:MAG: hydrolase [Actinomycetota bacterium]|nr:hydrolase [Actinomycetota bacterium]
MSALLAADLAEVAAAHAEAADTHRGLSPEVVKELVAAGFVRHFVPVRWGGAAGTVTELLSAVSTVAEGCASAAWCASLAAGAARMGAFLPDQGQHDLWASGPDVLVAGALIPSGQVETVDGGWLLSGQWSVTSGVDFADWALVCAQVEGASWFLAVPRADYTVSDTWFPVGMRGTGSNTLVLENVFVPAHRGFAREEMLHGRCVGSTARCHTAPLRVISGVLFAAPALGAAKGALHAWTRWLAAKSPPPDSVRAARIDLARCAGDIDAADLLLRRVAATGDQESVTNVEAARNPRDCALAVDYLVGAVERLFRASGSQGALTGGTIQRTWRDVHCISSHIALRFDTAGAAYGGQVISTVH